MRPVAKGTDYIREGQSAAPHLVVQTILRERVTRRLQHLVPRGLHIGPEDVGGQRRRIVAVAHIVGVNVLALQHRLVRQPQVFEFPHQIHERRVSRHRFHIERRGEGIGARHGQTVHHLGRDLRAAQAQVTAVDTAKIRRHAQRKQVVEPMLDLVRETEDLLVPAVVGPQRAEIPRDVHAIERETVDVAIAMPRERVQRTR